ncbi:MAG: outer membrane beta-barrel family protein, partial [Bacteroidota bacterium]
NRFEYKENVYAGYISFARPINKKWSFSAGLRAEQTDATGDLQVFSSDTVAAPVIQNYLSWFPSAGVTWQVARKHLLALNYGRRINRPDYNVLNPFRNQLSQLSFEKGNPFLLPEIVNNLELGYTLAYRYNFKLAYSRTTDQITRLIGPDDEDERASFITWENLAEQTVFSLNISAPFQVNKWWNAYVNFSASHLDNQADYGEGGVVDVQAFTYSIYQQHTFTLPAGFRGEISGYFSGPGVWGGVFEYETSWSLDIGLQRKFLNDQLNVRIAASDLFYETGWDGVSVFNGLESTGSGRWDSRRVSLSINYRFGNSNVKSRKRKTGLEAEADRVGG